MYLFIGKDHCNLCNMLKNLSDEKGRHLLLKHFGNKFTPEQCQKKVPLCVCVYAGARARTRACVCVCLGVCL